MQRTTKDYLIQQYNNSRQHSKSSCIKFYYKYNNVNVNLYFDAYEPESTNLSLVLIYEKYYYFKVMNILNENLDSEYLKDIPNQILNRILVDNSLKNFYETMEIKVLNSEPSKATYDDKFFSNTLKHNLKYYKKSSELPFWFCIRHIRMTDVTLEKLLRSMDISRDTLQEIQAKNLTLVRTSDCSKRKELTVILDEFNIRLS